MSSRRPSPALVVSIISLVVALSGTAVAASHLLITSSSQVKNHVLTGLDIRNGSITGAAIRKGSLSASLLKSSFSGSSVDSTSSGSASEAIRKTGPVVASGGKAVVATLDLAPGAYAIFAKEVITPDLSDPNLINTIFKANKTVIADCTLDVAGDGDFSSGPIQSPGSDSPVGLQMQVTRTLGAPATATLTCETGADLPWHGADASIIALPVSSVSRTTSAP
ncbi:MAG: hypothetical protein QOF12_2204 [Solirubrobacteraceae bacterium]|jgi:hypothetical protein|nr:hypothetical protein [Solirubrobacteraceae bacterium]